MEAAAQKYCIECGTAIVSRSKFCPKCGVRQDDGMPPAGHENIPPQYTQQQYPPPLTGPFAGMPAYWSQPNSIASQYDTAQLFQLFQMFLAFMQGQPPMGYPPAGAGFNAPFNTAAGPGINVNVYNTGAENQGAPPTQAQPAEAREESVPFPPPPPLQNDDIRTADTIEDYVDVEVEKVPVTLRKVIIKRKAAQEKKNDKPKDGATPKAEPPVIPDESVDIEPLFSAAEEIIETPSEQIQAEPQAESAPEAVHTDGQDVNKGDVQEEPFFFEDDEEEPLFAPTIVTIPAEPVQQEEDIMPEEPLFEVAEEPQEPVKAPSKKKKKPPSPTPDKKPAKKGNGKKKKRDAILEPPEPQSSINDDGYYDDIIPRDGGFQKAKISTTTLVKIAIIAAGGILGLVVIFLVLPKVL